MISRRTTARLTVAAVLAAGLLMAPMPVRAQDPAPTTSSVRGRAQVTRGMPAPSPRAPGWTARAMPYPPSATPVGGPAPPTGSPPGFFHPWWPGGPFWLGGWSAVRPTGYRLRPAARSVPVTVVAPGAAPGRCALLEVVGREGPWRQRVALPALGAATPAALEAVIRARLAGGRQVELRAANGTRLLLVAGTDPGDVVAGRCDAAAARP